MHCVPMYHTFAASWDLPHQNMADGFWRMWSAKQQNFCAEAGLSFFLPTKQAYTELFDFWASTWCTFSEGSYSINRITMNSDCVTSQLSGLNSCEFQLSVSFQLFAKTTPNAVDSQQKAAQMSGWKQTARKNVASVKVRWCKQPDMTRSKARLKFKAYGFHDRF